jgi:hypothetical protein
MNLDFHTGGEVLVVVTALFSKGSLLNGVCSLMHTALFLTHYF